MQTRFSNRLRAGLVSVLALAALARDRDIIVLDETFSGFKTGPLMGVAGAQAEYHYVPDTAPRHGWVVSSFRSDPASHRAWRVVEEDGQRLMTQTSTNKWKEHHPLIVAGDRMWADYTVEARFMPKTADHSCGIAFRMHSDRRYYFFGVVGQRVLSRLVNEGAAFRLPHEEILGDAPFAWSPGTRLNPRVTVTGDTIRARMNDVAVGYSLFDDDGKVLWTLDHSIQDHADGVAIVDFDLNEATVPGKFYAARSSGNNLRGGKQP